jgi:hypothetical protein
LKSILIFNRPKNYFQYFKLTTPMKKLSRIIMTFSIAAITTLSACKKEDIKPSATHNSADTSGTSTQPAPDNTPAPQPTPDPTPVPDYTPVPEPTPEPEPVPSAPTGTHEEWMAAAGISGSDFTYVNYIVTHESEWLVTVYNKQGSGAYGLAQAKPADKMAPFGDDYMTNPVTQLKWANYYALNRYGSWAEAYNFWVWNQWW